MKAIVYMNYGPPNVLRLAKLERPTPKPNEMLIKVHASTVTSGTLWTRRGQYPGSKLFTLVVRLMFGLFSPRNPILGYEFAGEVEAVGEGVTQFAVGDRVFGTTTGLDNGAYAEYVCIPERWGQGVVALQPSKLSHAQAAALPIGAMTAKYLLDKAKLQPGQRVLVYGASGSVGTYAVQLARAAGAQVTGVCSTGNLELVKSLGATDVIDYTTTDFASTGETYDIIFDAVGKVPKSRCKSALDSGGRYVSVKSPTSELIDNLLAVRELVEAGEVEPVIDRSYPMEDIVEAHRYVEEGHKKGNVVVTIVDA